jgi:acetyl-CoA carboxylase biotin carboxyl carrier protein
MGKSYWLPGEGEVEYGSQGIGSGGKTMKKLDYDDVHQIFKLMKESNFEEIRLEFGSLKLDLKKSALNAGAVQPAPPSAERSKGKELTPIVAPMLGLFFRSSKPGDPALAEPGQEIHEEDVVCAIEVLQQRHPVKSGARGRIKQICVQDGQMVEFKQTLFLLES